MTLEDRLSKSDRVDFHVHIYSSTLAVIDAIATKYDCSRSSVVEAWAAEYAGMDMTGKVPPKKGGRPVKAVQP